MKTQLPEKVLLKKILTERQGIDKQDSKIRLRIYVQLLGRVFTLLR